MTIEERARVNGVALKSMADAVEEIRIELYSHNVLDADDKIDFDDGLFKIQSDLRDHATWLNAYSE